LLEIEEKIGEIDNKKLLDRFILKNPNPVLTVGIDGTVHYVNGAAGAFLEYWGVKKGEKIPQSLRHSIKSAVSQGNPKNLEIKVGNTTYSMVLYPLPGEDCVNLQGFDISYRVQAEEKLRMREKQYLSLSNLGRLSIRCKDFQAILEESARLIAQGLGTEFSTIAELMPDENFIVRAGYGWKKRLSGNPIVRGREHSQAGYTLLLGKPVILEDIETETRFKCTEFLKDHGVISGTTVLIGNTNNLFGVMGVYCTGKREFTVDDIYFLDSAAFLLSEIIERLHAEVNLRVHQKELEQLVEKRTLEYAEANERLAQEVTERRNIEKTLRNNLKFLETLLNTIPAPVLYKDNEGRHLGCNDILSMQIIGLEKEKIVGKTLPEIYRYPSSKIPLEIHKEDLELLQRGGSDNCEKKILCADGIIRDFLINRATFSDEAGITQNMVAVLLDVTKLRQVEKKFQNNVQFLKTLLDSIPSPVFQRDINDIYVNCNENFARQIMGLPKEMLIGGSFQEFQKRVPRELVEMYQKHDRKLIEKGGSHYYETKVVCADGIQRDFLVHKATYQDSFGEVAGVVGVMLDITQHKVAEKTVRKSEEKYRVAAEQTGQLIYDYDAKNHLSSWAGAIEELTGYSFEEFQGFTPEVWANNVYPEDWEKAVKAHESCMKNGEKYFEEYRFRRKDGSYFYVEDSGVYLKDENEDTYRVLGVIKNITERKKATESIRKSEEKYRIAAEQTGQIVYDYDPRTKKVDWAGAISELTGYSYDEFQEISPDIWIEHIHPDDRERVIEAVNLLFEKGEKLREEFRFRTKDGNYIHVEDRGVLLRGEKGDAYRVLGVMKDITGTKLASEKLKESEKLYRSFMKNFRGVAFQMELDFTPILVDGNVEEITGYTQDDFMSGKVDWYQIVFPNDLNMFFESRSTLLNDPLLLIEQEYRIKHRDGTLRFIRELIQNVSDSTGKKRILQGAIYDITRQKEAEESLKKVEEIRKKEIHHRIKNNLQVISSLLELQAEKFNEKEVLEAFRESQNRVATMAIIHEELYRSKNNETLDFSVYLQKLTVDLLRSYTVREGDISMLLDLDETFLGMDTAVPLGIIINELVSNSLKHAFPPGRKGEIRIKLCRTEESMKNKTISNIINNIGSKSSVDKSNQYQLEVSDNGLGFPENIDFRNTSSLGLQLVNILVEQLDGTIELENGAETVFKILFKEND
jgi:PAS domain S-box-containing protein